MRSWLFWGCVAVLVVVALKPEVDGRRQWQAALQRDMGWSGKAPK